MLQTIFGTVNLWIMLQASVIINTYNSNKSIPDSLYGVSITALIIAIILNILVFINKFQPSIFSICILLLFSMILGGWVCAYIIPLGVVSLLIPIISFGVYYYQGSNALKTTTIPLQSLTIEQYREKFKDFKGHPNVKLILDTAYGTYYSGKTSKDMVKIDTFKVGPYYQEKKSYISKEYETLKRADALNIGPKLYEAYIIGPVDNTYISIFVMEYFKYTLFDMIYDALKEQMEALQLHIQGSSHNNRESLISRLDQVDAKLMKDCELAKKNGIAIANITSLDIRGRHLYKPESFYIVGWQVYDVLTPPTPTDNGEECSDLFRFGPSIRKIYNLYDLWIQSGNYNIKEFMVYLSRTGYSFWDRLMSFNTNDLRDKILKYK